MNFSHEEEKKETLTLNNCHSIMSSMDIASQKINIPTKRANLIAIFIETQQFLDSWRSTEVNPNLMETIFRMSIISVGLNYQFALWRTNDLVQ